MSKKELKVEYWRLTSKNGNAAKKFEEYISKIQNNIDESKREISYNNFSLNLKVQLVAGENLIIGFISGVRPDAPNKRRLGSTSTQIIDLEKDEGINESSFFVFDVEKNLLAMTYNHHGPRIGALVFYINSLMKEYYGSEYSSESRLSFTPIIIGSELDLAFGAETITAITARPRQLVDSGAIPKNASWLQLMDGFILPETISQEITYRDRSGKIPRALLRKLLPNKSRSLGDFEKLQVRCREKEGERITTHDLIRNKLTKSIFVETKPNSKELDSSEILGKMCENLRKTEEETTL